MASSFQKDFPVPECFPQILQNFAKEILRVQPECILTFGVKYFDKLLRQDMSEFKSIYNVNRQDQKVQMEYNKDQRHYHASLNQNNQLNNNQQQNSLDNNNKNEHNQILSNASQYQSDLYKRSIHHIKSQEKLVSPRDLDEEQQKVIQHFNADENEDDEKTLQTFKLKEEN